MRVKIVLEIEQELNPEFYREGATPEEMVQCDLDNDPGAFLSEYCSDIKILSVKEL